MTRHRSPSRLGSASFAPAWPVWAALSVVCAPQLAAAAPGDEVVGRWRMVSHIATFGGSTFDSHAALLQQRPCASAIVYELRADKSYRLDASASGCDEKYKAVQEKLYSRTKWKVDGHKITTSATDFAVGQTYTWSVTGNRMTWVGTEGQGTLVFQK